ncbi:MAG: hypothetical protein JWR15_3362 [Prosthecobacter sp.]|nr:hypothetical protein [Prosthecobacter sp.]
MRGSMVMLVLIFMGWSGVCEVVAGCGMGEQDAMGILSLRAWRSGDLAEDEVGNRPGTAGKGCR